MRPRGASGEVAACPGRISAPAQGSHGRAGPRCGLHLRAGVPMRKLQGLRHRTVSTSPSHPATAQGPSLTLGPSGPGHGPLRCRRLPPGRASLHDETSGRSTPRTPLIPPNDGSLPAVRSQGSPSKHTAWAGALGSSPFTPRFRTASHSGAPRRRCGSGQAGAAGPRAPLWATATPAAPQAAVRQEGRLERSGS